MQRRTWLRLGLASAAVLAVGGGGLALLEPGLPAAQLSPGGRRVFHAVGRAALDGSLPTAEPARTQALEGLLMRIDALVAALPAHAQQELSQLLSLLASAPGRRMLAGVAVDWDQASVADLQQGLEAMRFSPVSLRQQAYLALHDITAGAYFSDAGTWPLMGYPGPLDI